MNELIIASLVFILEGMVLLFVVIRIVYILPHHLVKGVRYFSCGLNVT